MRPGGLLGRARGSGAETIDAVAERKRLTAQDWTAAALAALARGGIAAVAVEPIAASLGATKGSFYWHFDNRDALLEAALREWERTDTDDVIALVETEPDIRRRLRTLLSVALGSTGRPGERVELALQPTADHPLVAPVLARVTARRLDYLTDLFVALGFPPDEARQRSLLAYTAYLGHAQLAHATPGATPAGDALPTYVDAVIATLTAR
jgi:AcrR family transcriptional regulator